MSRNVGAPVAHTTLHNTVVLKMSFKDDLNLFVGAKYGIFKGLKVTEGQPLINKSIQSLNHLSKEHDISVMAWSDETEEEILLGLSNQTVKVYDTQIKAFTSASEVLIKEKVNNTENEKLVSTGSLCGLARFDGATVTAAESGHVRCWRYEESEAVTINTGGPLSRMRHAQYSSNIIGTGGKENELKLWDLHTGKNTFTAKNVPHDFLQMRVPVWVSDLAFLRNSEQVVVGSRYGYVRVYDPKAQRRPVIKIDLPEKAVTCMAIPYKEHTVMCGLAKGNIVAMDLRMARSAQNYKGFLGAVRDIVCHPTEPYMASVGLDRFVRIHHITTKELLCKEYLVSRMLCVLMRSDFSLKPSAQSKEAKKKVKEKGQGLLSDGESDSEAAQEYDEVFNAMETVGEKAEKKKRKMERGTETPRKRKSLLLLNPFATPPVTPMGKKHKEMKPKEEKCETKKDEEKPVPKKMNSEPQEDSDDDIIIISETVSSVVQPLNEAEGGDESERDEAEGDSDELEMEDSDELELEGSDELEMEGSDESGDDRLGSEEEDDMGSEKSSPNTDEKRPLEKLKKQTRNELMKSKPNGRNVTLPGKVG